MAVPDRSHALDHVVVVLFENRSLDNVLGRLYGPEDGKDFEGVIGKDLSNPIPAWAEHGADRKVVPYTVATDMDSPNPDSGEEYPHTNTQLYNILSEENRFKMGEDMTAPWNAPEPGQTPTMDGFVTDYINFFTAETGRQPTYEEYSQIMTGFTPEQVPVLNGLARGFGVFDHWFCEVPSQTFMNRSFWTAATSSGFTVNVPAKKWLTGNDAETIFDRLEPHGKTWKVYVSEPMQLSATGLIHYPRLKDRLATHFVPFAQFEVDAANGALPDFSLIEPCLTMGHNDYHPAYGRALAHGVTIPSADPPSSILGGEEFLARIYDAYRGMQSETGSNVWNTTLLIGWDEPGGTYDHVPPPTVPPPDPAGPAGECGFRFDRSGYRVPAIIVSPWVAEGACVQPGASPHLTDRHPARAVEPGRPLHRPGRRGPNLLPRLHPRGAPGPQIMAGPNPPPGANLYREDNGPRPGRVPVGQDLPRRTPAARARQQRQTRGLPDDPEPTSRPSRS